MQAPDFLYAGFLVECPVLLRATVTFFVEQHHKLPDLPGLPSM